MRQRRETRRRGRRFAPRRSSARASTSRNARGSCRRSGRGPHDGTLCRAHAGDATIEMSVPGVPKLHPASSRPVRGTSRTGRSGIDLPARFAGPNGHAEMPSVIKPELSGAHFSPFGSPAGPPGRRIRMPPGPRPGARESESIAPDSSPHQVSTPGCGPLAARHRRGDPPGRGLRQPRAGSCVPRRPEPAVESRTLHRTPALAPAGSADEPSKPLISRYNPDSLPAVQFVACGPFRVMVVFPSTSLRGRGR